MSKKVLYILAPVFLILASVYFIQPDTDEAKRNMLEEKSGPFDHFFFQRSFPDEKLNLKEFDRVMDKARTHAFEQKSNSSSTNTPWTQEGPKNIGGRLNCIAVHPDDENTILTGSSAGGIFKTTNGGGSWTSISDDFAYLPIGCINYDLSNPDVIYAGTGDPNISGLPHIGNGVYKSTDGGDTWEHKGLTDQRIISRITINPENTQIVYAATMGIPFERNDERGLYKSTDGGDTWDQVLFVSDEAGIIDLLMNPDEPDVLYAASWNRIRNNQESMVTGTDAHVYKTTDGGANWNILDLGFSSDTLSRIGLAMSATNPDYLYATAVGENMQIEGIYRSYDGGDIWVDVFWDQDQMGNALGGFGWYFGQIRVNPFDDDEITILGVDMYTTSNGGTSWQMSTPVWWEYSVHADKHDMVYLDANTVLLATDGGLYKGTNSFSDWEDIDEIPNTQFYRVAVNPHNPGYYTAGAQDNGTTTGNINNISNWTRDYGGDGFQPLFSPDDSQLRYAETQNGNIVYNNGDWWEDFTWGINDDDRRNWDMPIIMSSENSQVMYTGTYRVYRNETSPFGIWEPISGDLTDGIIYGARYHTITTVAESKANSEILYAGTTDGNVWRTLDGGDNWDNITDGLPERYVTNIKTSADDESVVYVTHSGFKDNDNVSYIHKSLDNGDTWTSLGGDLPELPVNHIEIYTDSAFVIATDAGVYYTNNEGDNWGRVGNNMPLIPVFDIELDLAENTLVAGTFARSLMTFPIDSLFNEIETPVDTSNGVGELSISKINVYPNPSQDIIRLAGIGENTEYKIYSLAGKLIQSGSLNNNAEVISVRHLSHGRYFVEINDGEKHTVESFIKMD